MADEGFPPEMRERILRAARIASDAGLFVANQGNFSMRDPRQV